MISEYAVEPEVVARDYKDFYYLYEKFGVDQGRLVADFPSRKWARQAIKAINTKRIKGRERKQIVSLLEKMILTNGRPTFGDAEDWLLKAEAEHCERPFHAIVARSNLRNHPRVCSIKSVYGGTGLADLWGTSRGDAVPKKASNLANAARPLILSCKQIKVVDKDFNPSVQKWQETFEALVAIAAEAPTLLEFEIHLRANPAEDTQRFRHNCEVALKPLLPEGFTVALFRWEEMQERMHPRYLLFRFRESQYGGIRYDYGLDNTKYDQTTDLELVDRALCERRWKDYQQGSSPFELFDNLPLSFTG